MTEQLPKALSPWTEEDVKQHKVFDDLISRKVTWNVSTPELIQVYRSLVWMAQLQDKIKQSQAEIIAVHKPEDVQAAKGKKAK